MVDPIQEENQPTPINRNPPTETMTRPEQIHIYNVKEFRYWTKTLGVSSDALVSAVRAVGNDPSKVTEYLQGLRAS
jgi:hypothetical protein